MSLVEIGRALEASGEVWGAEARYVEIRRAHVEREADGRDDDRPLLRRRQHLAVHLLVGRGRTRNNFGAARGELSRRPEAYRLLGLRAGLSGSGLSHGSHQEGRRGAVLNRPGRTASETSWRTVSASGTSAASLTGAGHPATSFGTYLPVIHRPRASCPKGRWRRRR